MPPKRRGPKASVSTPKTAAGGQDDPMDVDTPQAAETPTVPGTPARPTAAAATAAAAAAAAAAVAAAGRARQPPAEEILNDLWTDDETSSLLKAIIRWKPTGMHKHFRMIAISEHLRNHGHWAAHTHIAGIWAKLRTYFNLDVLDDRDDAFDYNEPEDWWQRYKPFDLPDEDFFDMKMARRLRGDGDPAEVASSGPDDAAAAAAAVATAAGGVTAPAASLSSSSSFAAAAAARKRRRATAERPHAAGAHATKGRGRGSTVGDTEDEKARSPARKSARGSRGQRRAAAVRRKVDSTEPEADEESEEAEDDDEEEAESEAEPVKAPKPTLTRGAPRGRGGRGRVRQRGRRGGRN